MKNLFVFFLFLFIAASLNAQWQPEVGLTNDTTNSYTSFGNTRCIAADGNVIHVVWYDGVTIGEGNWKIYYKRSSDNGLTWSANVNLSNNVSLAYNPAIAVSGSYVHVVWYENRDGNMEEYYKRSTDGGISWSTETRLTFNDASSSHCSIAASGLNVHLVWQDRRDGNIQVYYKRSIDGGNTWSADARLRQTNNATGTLNLLPAVAVSGSVVHVAWHDSADGNWEIYYKRSTDGGINWGADIRLTNNSAISQFPTLAVSGSIVHLMWVDDRNSTGNIYYKRSVNGGSSWGSDTRLTKSNYHNYYPSLAVNGSNVHLVFQRLLMTGYDIMYNISNNDGVKWGNDVQLTNNSSHSTVPSIAVSGSNVNIIFRDNRDENYEIYYKRYIVSSGRIHKGVTAVDQEEGLPTEFQLIQNYPNPFNPTTTISFSIFQAEFVTLKVYDILGREVVNLINEFKDAGNYKFNFDASKLSSGIYFYRLQAGNFVDMKKMILMK